MMWLTPHQLLTSQFGILAYQKPLKVMSEENQDELESENQVADGEIQEQENSEADGQQQGEDQDDQKDYKQIAEDQRRRAEKAEADLKAEKALKEAEAKKPKPKEVSKKTDDGLTQMDVIALSKANIHEDDIEEVVRWAKFNNIDVKTALKDKTMQTVLHNREEERTTAEATNTGNARRGTSKATPDQILSNAEQGKFPENPEDLAEARHRAKFKK